MEDRGDLMDFVGIDIGSTATKVAIRGDREVEFMVPSGWNSKETAIMVRDRLIKEHGVDPSNAKFIATGYGRISVPYADDTVTEITCHAMGVMEYIENGIGTTTVIDVGGQDTKVITLRGGMVDDFIMNDKCSAGTGRFLEIMANRMGMDLNELFEAAVRGKILKISSMCTVFAESEVIGLMGAGENRDDIAAGVVDSVAQKVANLARRHGLDGKVVLTGGLSVNKNFVDLLSKVLDKKVETYEKARFAGAIGAALIGIRRYERKLKHD